MSSTESGMASSIDAAFDAGHQNCGGGPVVSVDMCGACVEILSVVLRSHADKVDVLDPDIAYYFRTFAADLLVQAAQQIDPEYERL